MRVSLAIPCYNGGRFLRQTLASVLAQTCLPDEILVVDDGSSDESAPIVRQMESQVRLVQHDRNRGLAAARNTAIRECSGDVIVFLDVDACADAHFIEALLAEYSGPEVGGVGGQGIEANIQTIYDLWRKLNVSQTQGPRRLERCPWLVGMCSSFRRSALLEAGGYDTFYRTNAEDHDVGYRLKALGYNLIYTPEAQVYHQRADDWRSLHRLAYNYVYWDFLAETRARRNPTIRLYLNFIFTNLGGFFWRDLLQRHNPGLAVLDVSIFVTRLLALAHAVRAARGMQGP